MICHSQDEANAVALAGFRKMTGYKVEPSVAGMPNMHHITNPKGDVYLTITGVMPHCDCPFFQANKDFKTCKHILLAEETEQTRVIEEQAQVFDSIEDYRSEVNFDKVCREYQL